MQPDPALINLFWNKDEIKMLDIIEGIKNEILFGICKVDIITPLESRLVEYVAQKPVKPFIDKMVSVRINATETDNKLQQNMAYPKL